MNIEVKGITYYLERHQQLPGRPILLLLHGFMGSGRAFNHLIPRLKKVCNPITIDLLGHGRTADPASPDRFSLNHQLNDLRHIIEQLQPTPLFLHGYSMGGRLALRFALRYPEMVTGLILESTNYGIDDEDDKKHRKKMDKNRARAIKIDFDSFLAEWQQLPLFNNGIRIPDELQDFYLNIQRQQDPKSMANSLIGFGTAQMESIKKELHQLSMPVLLLAGQHDTKYRSILHNMEELIPNSKFHIIKDAGHRIHLENPHAFIEHLKAFVLCA